MKAKKKIIVNRKVLHEAVHGAIHKEGIFDAVRGVSAGVKGAIGGVKNLAQTAGANYRLGAVASQMDQFAKKTLNQWKINSQKAKTQAQKVAGSSNQTIAQTGQEMVNQLDAADQHVNQAVQQVQTAMQRAQLNPAGMDKNQIQQAATEKQYQKMEPMVQKAIQQAMAQAQTPQQQQDLGGLVNFIKQQNPKELNAKGLRKLVDQVLAGNVPPQVKQAEAAPQPATAPSAPAVSAQPAEAPVVDPNEIKQWLGKGKAAEPAAANQPRAQALAVSPGAADAGQAERDIAAAKTRPSAPAYNAGGQINLQPKAPKARQIADVPEKPPLPQSQRKTQRPEMVDEFDWAAQAQGRPQPSPGAAAMGRKMRQIEAEKEAKAKTSPGSVKQQMQAKGIVPPGAPNAAAERALNAATVKAPNPKKAFQGMESPIQQQPPLPQNVSGPTGAPRKAPPRDPRVQPAGGQLQNPEEAQKKAQAAAGKAGVINPLAEPEAEPVPLTTKKDKSASLQKRIKGAKQRKGKKQLIDAGLGAVKKESLFDYFPVLEAYPQQTQGDVHFYKDLHGPLSAAKFPVELEPLKKQLLAALDSEHELSEGEALRMLTKAVSGGHPLLGKQAGDALKNAFAQARQAKQARPSATQQKDFNPYADSKQKHQDVSDYSDVKQKLFDWGAANISMPSQDINDFDLLKDDHFNEFLLRPNEDYLFDNADDLMININGDTVKAVLMYKDEFLNDVVNHIRISFPYTQKKSLKQVA